MTKSIFAGLVSGFGMWVVGGLWHNLILPSFNENFKAHHEGLGVTLIAYIILAILMVIIFNIIERRGNTIMEGLKLGILVGIMWVFPHGLVMAATHDSSILYEIKNTIYHIFEQGIGGIILSLFYLRSEK